MSEIAFSCPESVFVELATATPGRVFEFLIYDFAIKLGVALAGLFIAFFGAGIRTVMIFFNTFMIMGLPLLTPVFTDLGANVKSFADFNPGYLTSIVAAFIAAANACIVVMQASEKSKSMLQGFTTGALFSGFFMGFWLPELDKVDGLTMETKSWIIMILSAAPGAFLAGMGANLKTRELVWSLSYAILGGFMFIGPFSSWVGGGSISLAALATGEIGACAPGGFVSQAVLAMVVFGGLYYSKKSVIVDKDGNKKQKPPPGKIGAIFAVLFIAEKKLLAATDPEEKMRQQLEAEKAKAERQARGEPEPMSPAAIGLKVVMKFCPCIYNTCLKRIPGFPKPPKKEGEKDKDEEKDGAAAEEDDGGSKI